MFLDEIGELSPLLQAKLLRVLEDQVIRRVGGVRDMQVDVRVIAASNRDLEKAVREGHFRQDLYYRLAIIAIFIPPLARTYRRHSPAGRFLHRLVQPQVQEIDSWHQPGTRRLLLAHNWPGNVRELKNSIERAMILEDESILPPRLHALRRRRSRPQRLDRFRAQQRTRGGGGGKQLANGRVLPRLYIPEEGTSLEEVERAMVELAMRQANGNQTHAARLLDISRDALRYKLKKFELVSAGDEEAVDSVPSENSLLSPLQKIEDTTGSPWRTSDLYKLRRKYSLVQLITLTSGRVLLRFRDVLLHLLLLRVVRIGFEQLLPSLDCPFGSPLPCHQPNQG